MRKYIDLISSPPEILVESQNYKEMYNKLQQFADADAATTGATTAKTYLENNIKDALVWAKTHLKRKDRIVWYLRIDRIEIAHGVAKALNAVELSDQCMEYWQKLREEYQRFYGEQHQEMVTKSRFLRPNLEHFLSLPIPEIQNTVFERQGAENMLNDFGAAEYEWKQRTIDAIPAQDGDDVIMDFGDGWCWVDLHKAYCSKEASAMGHCGNQPRQGSGDTILSLRKGFTHNGTKYWEPHLTFILNGQGNLTEMKGKGNDKPADRYHKYIVPLILSDRINGIAGGGYLPENNFSLDDLDEEEFKEIIEKKPELGTVKQYFDIYGWDETLENKITSFLRQMHLDIWDIDENECIVDRYDDFEDILYHIPEKYPGQPIKHRNAPGDTLKLLHAVIDQGFDDDFAIELFPMLASMENLEDSLRENPEDGEYPDPQYDAVIERIKLHFDSVERFVDVKLKDISAWIDATQRQVKEHIHTYLTGFIERYPFSLGMLSMRYNEEEDAYEVYCTTKQMINAIDELQSDDEDGIDGYELRDLYNDSWLKPREEGWEWSKVKSPQQFLDQIQRAVETSFRRLLAKLTGTTGQMSLPLEGGSKNYQPWTRRNRWGDIQPK